MRTRTGAATEAPEPLELIAGFPMSELVVRSDPRRSGRKQVTGSGLTEGPNWRAQPERALIRAPRAGTQRHRRTPPPAGDLFNTKLYMENRAIGGGRPTRFPPGPISSHPEWVPRGPTEATRGPTHPEPL